MMQNWDQKDCWMDLWTQLSKDITDSFQKSLLKSCLNKNTNIFLPSKKALIQIKHQSYPFGDILGIILSSTGTGTGFFGPAFLSASFIRWLFIWALLLLILGNTLKNKTITYKKKKGDILFLADRYASTFQH